MPKPLLLAAAFAAVISTGGPIGRAAAMPPAAPMAVYRAAPAPTFMDRVCFGCRRKIAWAPREYWQWDHRPVWDDPWAVLRPNFWGSPEPYLVPADIWACKWHLPSRRDWRHRRHCGVWHKALRTK